MCGVLLALMTVLVLSLVARDVWRAAREDWRRYRSPL